MNAASVADQITFIEQNNKYTRIKNIEHNNIKQLTGSNAIQRGNAARLLGTFPVDIDEDEFLTLYNFYFAL